MEIASILGPLVVTALALSPHPASALAVCSFSLLIGGLSLSSLKVVDSWSPEVRGPSEMRLFRVPGIRLLAVEGIFIGMGGGIFNIALPAFATLRNVPQMTSIILGIQSATMIIGSLVAGTIGKHWTPLQAFTRNYIFWTLAALPLALTTPGPSLMIVAGILGIFVGAQQVFYLEILEHVRPKGAAASALGWMWTIEGSAAAIGSAIAGYLSESISPQFCFALTTATVIAGGIVTFSGQKYLQKANKKEVAQ
jgi:MFS family permease